MTQPERGTKRRKRIREAACKCLSKVQATAAERGFQLDTCMSINFKTGKATVRGPLLAVKRLEGAPRNKKLPTVLPAYCPFCGRKFTK